MSSGDSKTLPTSPALTYSIGRVDHPPTYYEVFTPTVGSTKPPVVMIHGGAHTGSCYLATPDGRQGWGHVFVAQGYQVVVPDWPGLGRSGYIPLAETSGEVIVAGLGEVLTTLAGPAIVLTHSMSGAYGWEAARAAWRTHHQADCRGTGAPRQHSEAGGDCRRDRRRGDNPPGGHHDGNRAAFGAADRTGVRRSHADRRKHIVSARPDCQLRRRTQSDPGTAAAGTAQCCRQPVARRGFQQVSRQARAGPDRHKRPRSRACGRRTDRRLAQRERSSSRLHLPRRPRYHRP